MQAWQQVKVKNDQSAHYGKAGCVVRVELVAAKGKTPARELVFVRLDDAEGGDPVVQFDAAELDILG